MRLLLIANDFPNPLEPTKGIFNLYLARALAREHRVRVISPISWLDELKALRRGYRPFSHQRTGLIDDVEVYYPQYYYPPKILREHYGWFYWRSVHGTIRRLMAAQLPDAVLGYWIHPDGEAAVRAAQAARIPSAVIVGGSDVLLITQHPGRRRRVVDVLQSTDAVVTVNRNLKEAITGFGIDPGRIHIWQQGVDTGQFSPGDRMEARRRLGIPVKGRVLLWVGRMVSAKGLDVLIEACAILQERGIALHLYLVGDGPLRPALVSECRARGLSDIVTCIGARLHDQLPDWYRAADLTVLPSRSEGLPNVLRESLACGIPFVASRVGGIPEIAEEGSSRLVAPGDPMALAEAIALALAEWGPSSQPRSRSTGWAESAEALLDIIRPLASASGGTGVSHAVAT